MFVNRQQTENIPFIFNGYPMPLLVKICKIAQNILNEENPNGYNPTPFVEKTDIGCQAVFKTQAMVDKVEEIMRDVATHEFPISHKRIIEICFNLVIQQDDEPDHFINHIEGNTFFLCHSTEKYAEYICEKMVKLFEKYMVPHPVILVADLIEECSISLNEDERLMVSCEHQTFLIPIANKEEAFFKEFNAKLKRIKKMEVDSNGIQFLTMKQICSEIIVKGVFYYITPVHVELTGLEYNLKKFSEVLRRRIKEKNSENRVFSRK